MVRTSKSSSISIIEIKYERRNCRKCGIRCWGITCWECYTRKGANVSQRYIQARYRKTMKLPLSRILSNRRRYMEKPLVEKVCQCGCNKKFMTRSYGSKLMINHRQKLRKKGTSYKHKFKVQKNATLPYLEWRKDYGVA